VHNNSTHFVSPSIPIWRTLDGCSLSCNIFIAWRCWFQCLWFTATESLSRAVSSWRSSMITSDRAFRSWKLNGSDFWFRDDQHDWGLSRRALRYPRRSTFVSSRGRITIEPARSLNGMQWLETQSPFHSTCWWRKRSYCQPLEFGLNMKVCFYIEGLRENRMVWFLMRWLLRFSNMKAAKTLTESFGSISINFAVYILWI
jgi:hypothetical protein